MLISIKWLNDYVDIEITPEELADKLTMAGFEVEAINRTSPGFSGVVVAKILSVKPHPNADKLSLCEISTGDQTFPVVCGAKNIKPGDIVPLAKVGATIPGGYTIKLSKLRGEPSEGMLCSEEELGIGDDNTGIMMLPEDLKLGEDLSIALDLEETVLDVAVTPNRPDCLSMIGMAREIGAITGKKIRYPEVVFSETEEDIEKITSVKILDPDLCPRYTARIIKNVEIKSSPAWMRMRLESIGLRAINNIVDVTNFVMMEYGQPLHAFDYRFLEEGRIVVRGTGEGEEFVSLDEKTRTLKASTLMVCDGVKPVAVAGIMGGLNSEVKDDTQTVLIESAYFNPSSIHKSSRYLGMNTDAAFRFERGIDPEGVTLALNRAAQLMSDLSGGSVCKGFIDQFPGKIETVKDVLLRPDNASKILGVNIDSAKIETIFDSLEMSFKKNADGTYTITPPAFRMDISEEADLVEEIARLYGYDNIPASFPVLYPDPDAKNKKGSMENGIRSVLNGCGYSEVINYTFTTPESVDILGIDKKNDYRKFIKIRNPLTEDTSVLRTNLLYGLLETMKRNINAGNHNLKIFEMGKVFIATEDGKLPVEKATIGGLVTGLRYENSWHFGGLQSDFYDLKGCLETLFDAMRIDNIKFASGVDLPFLHPGKSCTVTAADKCVGFLGEIHPEVLDKMDMKNGAILFELDLEILSGMFSGEISSRNISKFPSTSRDVAFVVDMETQSETILNLALDEEKELLEDIYIFDVYTGSGIPEGMKSLAVKFIYRSHDKTLMDDEVNEVHDRIVEKIAKGTGATIRGRDTSGGEK